MANEIYYKNGNPINGQQQVTKSQLTEQDLIAMKTQSDNTDGTNTGDETTGTIQSKRPLKTVNSQSLEGVGGVVLTGENLETSTGSGFTVNGAIVTIQGEVVILQNENLAQQIEIDNKPNSVIAGEPTGSDVVGNIVSLTQSEYDEGTPVATTFYLITDA